MSDDYYIEAIKELIEKIEKYREEGKDTKKLQEQIQMILSLRDKL